MVISTNLGTGTLFSAGAAEWSGSTFSVQGGPTPASGPKALYWVLRCDDVDGWTLTVGPCDPQISYQTETAVSAGCEPLALTFLFLAVPVDGVDTDLTVTISEQHTSTPCYTCCCFSGATYLLGPITFENADGGECECHDAMNGETELIVNGWGDSCCAAFLPPGTAAMLNDPPCLCGTEQLNNAGGTFYFWFEPSTESEGKCKWVVVYMINYFCGEDPSQQINLTMAIWEAEIANDDCLDFYGTVTLDLVFSEDQFCSAPAFINIRVDAA